MSTAAGPIAGDRYLVISADCHGGGEITEYRDYLEQRYRDDFDAWLGEFENPYADLQDEDASRNWDHDRRLRELEEDGIVAEVIFPNTVPPFYPKSSLLNQPPVASAGDLDLRWAGLRAHNRWLADFCAAAPGRRAGICQILIHDIDAAVGEVRWAKEAGLTGGVLLPGAPPGSGLTPLYDPEHYEPLWSVCEELEMPVNHHSGSASPEYGDDPVSNVVFMLEVTWFAHRALTHLIFGGAFERHPDLKLVLTEQGTAWVPEQLLIFDYFADRMAKASGSQEAEWGGQVVSALSLKPSEYFARQVRIGSSFIRPWEVGLRHAVGLDRIMWGADYPHREGSHPFSLEALRVSFAGVDPGEVQTMLATNAAEAYGFDVDALAPIAAEIGPRVADVATPLDAVPQGAEKCPAFAGFTPPQGNGSEATDQEG